MNDQFKLIRPDYKNIEKPFSGDLWDRKKLAQNLTRYVSRLKVGATIAIDAEWGAGKTWFVNNWKSHLEAQKFNVIYLDAFSTDYIDDPFLTLAMEITNKIELNPEDANKLKKSIIATCQSLLPHLPTLIWALGTSLIGAGYLGQKTEEVFGELTATSGKFGEELGEILNEKLKEYLENQVDSYQQQEKTLDYFKKTLLNIAQNFEQPLVFIVDELDRCKPEFSIRLIERIKHFFDIPNIVFVLAINKPQLSESINTFYGFKESNDYLEKFIDINIKLTAPKTIDYGKIIKEYSQSYGFIITDYSTLEILFDILKPNARQTIKVLQKLNFLNIHNQFHMTYASIHMLVKDLGLSKNSNDEFDVLKIFIEKVRSECIEKFGLKLNHSQGEFRDEIFDVFNSSPSIYELYNLYEKILESSNPDLTKRKYMWQPPSTREGNLSENWDNYISNGFIITGV